MIYVCYIAIPNRHFGVTFDELQYATSKFSIMFKTKFLTKTTLIMKESNEQKQYIKQYYIQNILLQVKKKCLGVGFVRIMAC